MMGETIIVFDPLGKDPTSPRSSTWSGKILSSSKASRFAVSNASKSV